MCLFVVVVVDAVGGFGNDDVGGVGSCIYRYISVLHRFFLSFVIIPSYQNFYVYLLFDCLIVRFSHRCTEQHILSKIYGLIYFII